MISFILRMHSPVPARERVREIVASLTGIGGSRSIGFGENRIRSLPDAVAKVLAKHSSFRVNGKVEDYVPMMPQAADQEVVSSGTNGKTNGVPLNGNANGHAKMLLDEENLEAGQQLSFAQQEHVVAHSTTSLFDLCPSCGSGTLAYEEGCK